MIRTSKFGAQATLEKTCSYSIRVRSGNIVLGDVRKYIFDTFLDGRINTNKIGFYMGWSWKNVPFHISDAFMVSRASDMLNLWSLAEDSRACATSVMPDVRSDSHFSELFSITNEYYLWTNYAKQLGYTSFSLHDYYRFILEHLVPLEPTLTTYSLKHTPIFNLDYDSGLSPNPKWWNSLNRNFDMEYIRSLSRYESSFSVRDYWTSKVG
jgi:hypothetical protein